MTIATKKLNLEEYLIYDDGTKTKYWLVDPHKKRVTLLTIVDGLIE